MWSRTVGASDVSGWESSGRSVAINAASKLALGTVQLGLDYGVSNKRGQIQIDEAQRILVLARRLGIDTLDTAVAYGDSEERIGQLGVDGFRVVTKLPGLPSGCIDANAWVIETVAGSLERLRAPCLHGLLLHRSSDLLGEHGPQLWAGLRQVKGQGLAEKIGVSIYAPQELDALGADYRLDLVQAPFSVVDRRMLESGWIERLADHGVELHVRSVFLQGLLLMATDDRPPWASRWQTLWDFWDRWLAQGEMTSLQACLRFVQSYSQISKIVVGVESESQLDAIARAADGTPIGVPDHIGSRDLDLLNPSRWSQI